VRRFADVFFMMRFFEEDPMTLMVRWLSVLALCVCVQSASALGFYVDGQWGLMNKHSKATVQTVLERAEGVALVGDDQIVLRREAYAWVYGGDVGVGVLPHFALEMGALFSERTQVALSEAVGHLPVGTTFNLHVSQMYGALKAYTTLPSFLNTSLFLKLGVNRAAQSIEHGTPALDVALGQKHVWVLPLVMLGAEYRVYTHVAVSVSYLYIPSKEAPDVHMRARTGIMLGLGCRFGM
jgi:hypothetical protein